MSLISCISGVEHKPGKFLFWRRAATTRPTVPVGRKFCILLSRKGGGEKWKQVLSFMRCCLSSLDMGVSKSNSPFHIL